MRVMLLYEVLNFDYFIGNSGILVFCGEVKAEGHVGGESPGPFETYNQPSLESQTSDGSICEFHHSARRASGLRGRK